MAGYQGTSVRRVPVEAFAAAVEAEQREVNTTLDGEIISYDRTTQRATIRPKLERKFGDKTLKAPDLKEIKVVQQSGGGYGVHVDLKKGDPVTLQVRQRSVDKSQTSGSDTNGAPGRMHDLSDAVAYPGGGSDSQKMSNMPAGGAHYGSTDGKSGLQTRSGGSSAIVGGPSGSDKLTVSAAGKLDLKGENGDSLFQIIRDLAQTFRDHTNTGAPIDAPFVTAAEAIIARLDAIHG